jgi:hypothetical protein
VTTDNAGKAVYTYSSSAYGIDYVVPEVNNTAGVVSGPTSYVYWETATLKLGSAASLPGATVTFTGTGYQPSENVTLKTNSTSGTKLVTVQADSSGNISGSFVVPVPATNTPVTSVVATGATSHNEGWAIFSVGCTDDWLNPVSGDFNTGSNWSTGAVPGSSDLACIIAPGTYTVTMNQGNTVGALVLGNGNSANGTQTLENPGHNSFLNLNGPSAIQAGGVLDLNSVDGNYSGISGGSLTNSGTLSTTEGYGSQRYIRTNLTDTATGTLTIGDFDTRFDQNYPLFNSGTVNVLPGGGWSFTGGGTLTQKAGTMTLGGLVLQNGTFAAAGGTLTGQATLSNSTLSDAKGKGLFILQCTNTLSGSIPAGQTVNIQGNGCGGANTTLAGTSVTNGGTLQMDSTNGQSSLIQGSPLINNGTLTVLQDNGGTRYIRVPVTNSSTGKITVSDYDTRIDGNTPLTNNGTLTITGSGGLSFTGGNTLTQAAGTLTVTSPGTLTVGSNINSTLALTGGTLSGQAVVSSGTLNDGAGATGTFTVLLQCGDNLEGTIPAGQTVNVQGNGCGGATANLVAAGGATEVLNQGTLIMDSTNGNSSLLQGVPLENAGTFQTLQDNGGTRYVRVAFTNDSTGTVQIGDFDTRMDGSTTTLNNGALNVSPAAGLSVNGGSFTQNGGTIADQGSVTMSSDTFTFGGGATTGNEIVFNSVTFNDNSAGAGLFAFRNGTTFNGTLDGAGNIPIASGQVVDVRDDCTGVAQLNASAGLDVSGQLLMSNGGTCSGYNVYISAPGKGINVLSGGVFTTNAAAPGHSGTQQITGSVTVAAGGVFTVDNVLFQNGSAVTNKGNLTVADKGDYQMNNGATFTNGTGGKLGVVADASGSSPIGYGITGSGADTVAGTLNVKTVGTPISGQSFIVVSGNSLTGTFATVNTGSTSYSSVNYSSTGVTLTK